MKQYDVTGMSCAACSARVEKAVSQVPGVTACSVSLLTNSMGVEGTASPEAIVKAVEEAGYGAAEKGAAKETAAAGASALEDRETPVLKRRLLWSVGFLAVLMYVSMGHMMGGWPVPAFFEGNPVALGLVQLLLAAIVMVINQKFFISGYRALWHRAPNMDTLVALGSTAAFVYSTYGLFAMTGPGADAMAYLHDLYFEAAAMILTLITVGKMLEARAKGRTTDALKSLMKLSPQKATVLRAGVETEVPIGQVLAGDTFVVRPGEHIPVDGVVLEGESAVNEAALTGESIPVDKAPGSAVSAATLNQSGFLTCRATRVGQDTTLAQIIRMVSDAAATKAPIAKVADKVSGIFVPAVIAIALATFVVWLLLGREVGYALARGISVLVISCPCALGLATPVAIMVGNGLGAKHGILFKTAVSLEETGKVDIVALDKTGTITRGEPRVTDLLPAGGVTEQELLTLAYALEQKSEHPLARAILERGQAAGIGAQTVTEFRALPGNGLTARWNGAALAGGNLQFISAQAAVSETWNKQAEALAAQGKTPLFFARDGVLQGVIAVADVLKEDSPQAIRELRNMGIRVVMLTGDNRRTAEAVGRELGVTQVIAEVLPQDKEKVVADLQAQGKRVAMIGDGINDAPALARADVGMAIGAGTDVAIESADVVLMKSDLLDAVTAVRLSKKVIRNIKENLFWAFIYNIIGIPLAAGVWFPITGWQLSPMFGAAAMSLSSVCVVSNALRLKFFRPLHQEAPAEQIETQKGSSTMTKTMTINGMMCAHCQAHVEKALNAIDGVTATVDLAAKTATVTLSHEVADEVLKNAVTEAGYEVVSID